MIWRWLISFKRPAVLFALASTMQAGTVSGLVTLVDSHADAVNKRRDYSGVVVSATPAATEVPAAQRSSAHAVMRQKNKTFSPHILPVTVGTQVDFPNFDPIFHNAFSSFNGQIFDVGLYPPGTSRAVRFSRPGVVRVFCNIHPAMSAIILVVNTTYFTETARDGSYSLELPPGDYELNLFHERATAETLSTLSKRLTITDQALRIPGISVSEAGYLMAPHKNKYGHDYASPPDDANYYPGAKK
jgi:plastocyanin